LFAFAMPATPVAAATPFSIAYEACPSTSTCFVVGNGIARTTNGGTSWTRQTVPSGTPDLTGISCSSTAICVAVGGNAVLRTTNGGANWTRLTVNPSSERLPQSLTSVSCPSWTQCHAVGVDAFGGGVIIGTSNGTTWAVESHPDRAAFLSGLSCPSATTCFAAGSAYSGSDFTAMIYVTRDSGAHWTANYEFPDSAAGGGTTYGFRHISCAGLTCVASGQISGPSSLPNLASVTADGGVHWKNSTLPAGFEPSGVRCAAASTCFLDAGSTLLRSTDKGTSWQKMPIPSGISDLSSLACASASTCFAYGETAHYLATVNNGNSWTPRTHP
jgi:photosystem II stability/assembly factor-like uncharacterized protein